MTASLKKIEHSIWLNLLQFNISDYSAKGTQGLSCCSKIHAQRLLVYDVSVCSGFKLHMHLQKERKEERLFPAVLAGLP
jgi:hypothetical protein